MNEFNLSSMEDDILLPDDQQIPENDTPPTEGEPTNDDTSGTNPPADIDDNPEPIDTSLKGVDGEPIDAPPTEGAGELYGTLAQALKEEGFFANTEDLSTIKDVSGLAEAFKNEIKANEYSDLTDSQKRVLQAFRDGVPEEAVVEHAKTSAKLSSITDDVLQADVELQKNLFLLDLHGKGVSESRAVKLYELAYDSGELLDEAKASLTTLQQQEDLRFQAEQERAHQLKLAEAKNIEDRKKAVKDSIYKVDKFLGEVAVTDRLKDKVHESISGIVGYTDDGTPLNALMKARLDDPLSFETNLYYLFELTNGFKDVKKFVKQADSKAARKLESLIANNTLIRDTSGGDARYADPHESDAGSIIELL